MEFSNPYKPGAGHSPPFLAGRQSETKEFSRLLKQTDILENMVITGLRGVGKTVLLEKLKPLALANRWFWVGSDMSETVSVKESNLAIRLLTDLSIVTSSIVINSTTKKQMGFTSSVSTVETSLNFDVLKALYDVTPGLASDKLRNVLETVFSCLPDDRKKIVFAYDEAQTLADNAAKEEFPLSVLLDVFQSIQRKKIPFMLVLVGLPTLFPKLVEARTFAERMFRIVFLDKLDEKDSRDAIKKPLEASECPVRPDEPSVSAICKLSGGYPYFLQFICREVYDIWVIDSDASIPINDITNKLDTDFFAGRWDRATDRQRELLIITARLPNAAKEFSVQEIVYGSKSTDNPFSSSHVNQMLVTLSEKGLIYKNRHGKYSFAVPLLERFINRQIKLGMV